MHRRLRVLFVPFGSEGDINPLLWLAGLLAERGHRAEFLITPHYGHLISRRGMPWHAVGTEEDFLSIANDPAVWKPGIGTWRVAQAMRKSLLAYRKAFRAAGGRFDLVVTSSFGIAGAALAEARGIPHLMLHLQPVCLRSRDDLPVMAKGAAWLCEAPGLVQNAAFLCVDAVLNRTLLPPLNNFRKSLGLGPLRDFYRDALHRATGIGLLFPPWFAKPQPDWPKGVRQFDFPSVRFGDNPLPPGLLTWLQSGESPVLWTHGSANVHLAESQELACGVTEAVGGRALLVGKIPPGFALPPSMFHCAHVPFEDVLPRCRAIVHHGGIGTMSKAFAAGIPQLVLPLAHDQHDNAARLRRLRCGLEARATKPAAAAALQNILESEKFPAYTARCRALSSDNPGRGKEIADWAEALADAPGPHGNFGNSSLAAQ